MWRLVSQLSLNYLSLTEEGVGALQEILRLHNFTDSSYLENQIGGITKMNSWPHFAIMESIYGNLPARGTRVEIELDERQFVGGGVYLFANVLDRFLGCYTSINSFCQLAARTQSEKGAAGRMATESGLQAADLRFKPSRFEPSRFEPIRKMLAEEPYSVHFFQAVRLLERLYPERNPVGLFVSPSSEVVRFSSLPTLSFPASEIAGSGDAGRTASRRCR